MDGIDGRDVLMGYCGIWVKGSCDLRSVSQEAHRGRFLTAIGSRTQELGYSLIVEDSSTLRVQSIGNFFAKLVTFGDPGPHCELSRDSHLDLLSLLGPQQKKYPWPTLDTGGDLSTDQMIHIAGGDAAQSQISVTMDKIANDALWRSAPSVIRMRISDHTEPLK